MTEDRNVDTTARTLWGEARGGGDTAMAAVANVIMNRAKRGGWFGKTPNDVCMKPYQFSCWNTHDPNREVIIGETYDNPAFMHAVDIARRAVAGDLPDATGGATHYYAKGSPTPGWVAEATYTTEIGGHLFFKNVR